MNNKYEIEWDESGLYVAGSHLAPGVFLEALIPQGLDEQIALAEVDLVNIRSDRPALRSRHVDLVRLTLVDQRFVNRGMGSGEYEIWAKGNVFLTVPAPIQAKRTPVMIFGFIFELWKRQSPS